MSLNDNMKEATDGRYDGEAAKWQQIMI